MNLRDRTQYVRHNLSRPVPGSKSPYGKERKSYEHHDSCKILLFSEEIIPTARTCDQCTVSSQSFTSSSSLCSDHKLRSFKKLV
ncbi:hypothetical protein WN55_02625 [Dufourea novaeangliae]|uniref:Uncharacterized protein n=1 Tax=Dufourea novaeangliae TaxID=178035 RepID=A0A154PHW2_DUFNO|nr:hypothetical protein WN55_02625 [Dufourea novaeangliae]